MKESGRLRCDLPEGSKPDRWISPAEGMDASQGREGWSKQWKLELMHLIAQIGTKRLYSPPASVQIPRIQ